MNFKVLNELLERKITEAAEWFCDNPNCGDIEDALRELVAEAISMENAACAKLAMTEAALQHELDTVRNPKNAVLHSPDSAKWQKMAAMIRMRSNKGNT